MVDMPRSVIPLAILISATITAADKPKPTLYTDAEIERTAKREVEEIEVDKSLFLKVVPSGKSMRRSLVFTKLGIDDARVTRLGGFGLGKVIYLRWQVSPSYKLSVMTALNDPENNGIELYDPKRKVYGVRLHKDAVK